ncbi:DUF262 domain-containing protein [Thiotrichales bacterium HSG1]|nr:DUF262 domain-containing protein [Thiotrichales bacterium HSG1]
MNNIEIENIDEDEYVNNGDIISPFKTKDIKITNKIMTLSNLIDKLKYDEIDLNPDFQRNDNLWNQVKMSRLIESILLKLPLPVFYFDVSDTDKWLIVDGLQRLSTIQQFIVNTEKKVLTLKNLEFLNKLNGKKYKELDRSLIRVINETNIVTYQIEAQTPKEVRYSIFNRINTGGLPLNPQEVRQALNQVGNGVKFLKDVSKHDTFKNIVNISPKRMLDRELILRFIAFKINPQIYENFTFNNMGEFLDKSMEELDKIKDDARLQELKDDLINTLEFSEEILGKGYRFSRSIADKQRTNTLNQSLFDVLTVCFSEIKIKEKFLAEIDIFKTKFIEMLKDENSEFLKSITTGTSGKAAIEMRFKIMNKLIEEILNEDW